VIFFRFVSRPCDFKSITRLVAVGGEERIKGVAASKMLSHCSGCFTNVAKIEAVELIADRAAYFDFVPDGALGFELEYRGPRGAGIRVKPWPMSATI
jgi:hypothetical protein